MKETKEVPEKSLYVDFRVPSEWRDYRVTARDQAGSAFFYTDLEEISMISKVLFRKITTVTRTRNGQMYGAGEITVGIWDFEILLRLICNSYEGVARSTTIAKYMKIMLVLAARYDITSLVEECKMVVLNANFSNVDTTFVQRWFEAFEDTKLDEIRNNHGNVVSRTIRSHIISEMSRFNKWHELFQFIPQNYLAPIRYRLDVKIDTWLKQTATGYFIWFIAGAIFHLVVVLIFLHGIRSERRSLLLPFLFLATFGVFVLIILVSINFVLAVQNSSGQKIYLRIFKTTLGIIIHNWDISVVWRCYFYFGDKKLAEQIHEQLQTPSLAFARDYSQPAPYMDTAEESPLITV